MQSFKKQFKLGSYLITYRNDIQTEIFGDNNLYGIIFILGRTRYQLVYNYGMERILINEEINPDFISGSSGIWNSRDIPFKPTTFSFLPEGVSAEEA